MEKGRLLSLQGTADDGLKKAAVSSSRTALAPADEPGLKAGLELKAEKRQGLLKPDQGKKQNQSRKHSPEELKNLIAKVELSLREQEAMLSVLDKEICKPENQVDPDNSFRLAREREAYEQTINDLMNRWEVLLQEEDELEE